jgi:hypothetical protein
VDPWHPVSTRPSSTAGGYAEHNGILTARLDGAPGASAPLEESGSRQTNDRLLLIDPSRSQLDVGTDFRFGQIADMEVCLSTLRRSVFGGGVVGSAERRRSWRVRDARSG